MTGIKVASMTCILSATDALNPVFGLPFEQVGAMTLSAFCVWQMWKLISRKDDQINRLISVMEKRPCLQGHLPEIPADDNNQK